MATTEELLELLVDRVEDEQLEAILAIEDEDERNAAAQAAFDECTDVVDIAEHGYDLVEDIREERDYRTGKKKSVKHGWLIKSISGDVIRFAGKSLGWLPWAHSSSPFDSREQAEMCCRAHIENMRIQNEAVSRMVPVKKRRLDIPVAELNGEVKHSTKVELRLNVDQSRSINAIRIALRQQNAELNNNKPIASNADVVRWMLEQAKT